MLGQIPLAIPMRAFQAAFGRHEFPNILSEYALRQWFTFMSAIGETPPANIRYVITLDSDTQLPRDAARQFVGTMAHPLNQPHYDAVKQRVTDGYGILQPRVVASLPGAGVSLEQKSVALQAL